MKRTWIKLDLLLQQLIYDAGFAMVYTPAPDVVAHCRRQYRRVVERLVALDPSAGKYCPTLDEAASAGCVRMAARTVRAYLAEEQKRLRRQECSVLPCLVSRFFGRVLEA